jgi:hypothetical protein
MHARWNGRGSKGRPVLSRLARWWCTAGAAAAVIALQACGGGAGGDAVQAREQPAAGSSLPVVQSAAAVVAAVDLAAPDGSSVYRIEQLDDGRLKIALGLGNGAMGDIRAFYFHMSGDNVNGLQVSGDPVAVTNVKLGANTVTQAGSPDTKLSKASGVATSGGFDVGVEIGTKSTAGADDVQSAVIFLSRTGGLALADIRYASGLGGQGPAYFGFVARSVGAPGTRRGSEINTVFVLPELPPEPPARVYEVGDAHLCVGDPLNVRCAGESGSAWALSRQIGVSVFPKQMAAGVLHSCALDFSIPGAVVCWDVAGVALPAPVLAAVPTQIAAGDGTTCAVIPPAGTVGEKVQCWPVTTSPTVPVAYEVALAGPIRDLAVGNSRACAVSSASGSVSCWDKDTGPTASKPLQTLALSVSQIDAFGGVACGTTATGGAACWGLAEVSVEPSSPPPDGLSGVTQVAVGDKFACALAVGGVTCWATTTSFAQQPFPGVLTVPTGLSDVRSIEAGGNTVCANRRTTGELVCWGALAFTIPVP